MRAQKDKRERESEGTQVHADIRPNLCKPVSDDILALIDVVQDVVVHLQGSMHMFRSEYFRI